MSVGRWKCDNNGVRWGRRDGEREDGRRGREERRKGDTYIHTLNLGFGVWGSISKHCVFFFPALIKINLKTS